MIYFKIAIILIIWVVIFLWFGEARITWRPFSISVPRWNVPLTYFVIAFVIVFLSVLWYKEGYREGYKEGSDRVIEMVYRQINNATNE